MKLNIIHTRTCRHILESSISTRSHKINGHLSFSTNLRMDISQFNIFIRSQWIHSIRNLPKLPINRFDFCIQFVLIYHQTWHQGNIALCHWLKYEHSTSETHLIVQILMTPKKIRHQLLLLWNIVYIFLNKTFLSLNHKSKSREMPREIDIWSSVTQSVVINKSTHWWERPNMKSKLQL